MLNTFINYLYVKVTSFLSVSTYFCEIFAVNICYRVENSFTPCMSVLHSLYSNGCSIIQLYNIIQM